MTGAPATYFEAERLAVLDRHVGGVEKLNEDVRGADVRQCPPEGFGAEVPGTTRRARWRRYHRDLDLAPAAGGDSVGSAGERVRASPACGHRQRPRLPT